MAQRVVIGGAYAQAYDTAILLAIAEAERHELRDNFLAVREYQDSFHQLPSGRNLLRKTS